MSISDKVAIGGLILALVTNAVLVLVWFIKSEKSGERKRYAAERNFEHLKNNQLQISSAINDLVQEVKGDFNILSRDLLEIKFSLGIDKKNSG